MQYQGYDLCERKKSVNSVLKKPYPEPKCHRKTLNSLYEGFVVEIHVV